MEVFIIKLLSPKEYKRWTCKATITFSIVNLITRKDDFSKSITHVFDESELSRSINFTSLSNWKSLVQDRKYFQVTTNTEIYKT